METLTMSTVRPMATEIRNLRPTLIVHQALHIEGEPVTEEDARELADMVEAAVQAWAMLTGRHYIEVTPEYDCLTSTVPAE